MHLHWERSTNTAGDCNIRSMSWMGRVPDEIPQDEGWKLNRVNYYQEGWLSTANLRGVVGVTYTTSHCGLLGTVDEDEKGVEPPQRTNYNLRGHLFEVTFVCWNEPYQKLATCDTSGVIFVWIKYEGRWSIELINDRHTPVICFSWSHDGRMALICYQDGFVLVGSVAGQRYWSTILPIETQQVTSGTWTPDDQFVYMGTSQGEILVMDLTGNMVNRVVQKVGVPIVELAWNCERFNMEEQNETATHPKGKRPDGSSHLLAVCHKDGEIHLIHSYDDIIPQVFNCGFQEYLVDWTNSGEILAVTGKERELTCKADHSFTYINSVLFYNDRGALIYKVQVPSDKSPVTAMTWGHNDKRLFVATGNQIHVAWVSHHIASLQLLSRLKVQRTLANADQVQLLPLPCRIQNLIGLLFTCTIRSSVPNPQNLRDFAIRPHPENVRLYCTMVRHGGDENVGSSYTLYLEHLGGFLPLLKGKKVSKLRPDFVIYDPAMSEENAQVWTYMPANHFTRRGISLSDPNEVEFDGDALSLRGQSSAVGSGAARLGNNQGSPRNRRRQQRRLPQGSSVQSRRRTGSSERNSLIENTECVNLLPEDERLAEVTSNFWGTKFQITSGNFHLLPLSLGEVTYKASLLHLQPRQMRLEIIDLLDDHRDPFGSAFNLDDDENEESDLEDSEFDQGVVMKDDILRAVKANANKSSESSTHDLDSDSTGLSNMNIAPIAPLPTRLSFCLTPRNMSAAATPCANNESTICEAILKEETEDHTQPVKVQRNVTNRKLRKSPVKTVVGQVLAKVEGIPLSQSDAILEDIHDSMEPVPSTSNATGQAMPMALGNLGSPTSSPSKRLLRMSVSCDNYLSEAKFALSRRDSVGSGSPHSSKGSPRRWAAKADEITRETDMATVDQVMAKSLNLADLTPTNPWHSNSANELDMIVDLLGVPSDLLGHQDLSKRLILLGDKKPKSKVSLDKIGKSASCDDEEYPKVTIVNGQKVVRRRRKKRLASEADKKRIEVKRQSIYAKNCRGRSETKSCQNCDAIAMAINDADLNKEIFDVPSKTKANLLDSSDTEDNIQVQVEDPVVLPKADFSEKAAHNGASLGLEQIKENIPSARQSREPRRFDGVRNILEKARGILLASSRFRSRSKSKESPQETSTTRRDSSVDITLHLSEDPPKTTTKSKRFRTSNLWSRGLSRGREDEQVATVAQNGTQSSPNTPLQMRKARNRSFSPVRALLNSPLLRRKKIPHPQTDSSEEDLVDCAGPRSSHQNQPPECANNGEEFRNLETFQKQKLKDKLKRINQPEPPGSIRPSRKNSTSNLNPTPSSTPQFLSPFLSRRGLALRSPNLSLSSRRDYLRNLSAPPPVKVRKRRKLVLRNKSPMWNDTSQVYQLDFGGRVTLESAKNFQIEYKDTQVMQFGRIDTNAYTLDFQYPFTAIQAFGVALANVTQRLK